MRSGWCALHTEISFEFWGVFRWHSLRGCFFHEQSQTWDLGLFKWKSCASWKSVSYQLNDKVCANRLGVRMLSGAWLKGSLNRLPPGRFGGCFYACTLQSPMAILKAMERSMMDKRNSKSTWSKHRKILKNPRNLSQQRWQKMMRFCALNWGDSRHLGSTKRNVERYPLLCDGRVPGWVVVMEMG